VMMLRGKNKKLEYPNRDVLVVNYWRIKND